MGKLRLKAGKGLQQKDHDRSGTVPKPPSRDLLNFTSRSVASVCLLSTSVYPAALLAARKVVEVRGPKPGALCGHQDVDASPLALNVPQLSLGTGGL